METSYFDNLGNCNYFYLPKPTAMRKLLLFTLFSVICSLAGSAQVSDYKVVNCNACHATGKCPRCNGKGVINAEGKEVDCSYCDQPRNGDCKKCHGQGKMFVHKTKRKVAPGV